MGSIEFAESGAPANDISAVTTEARVWLDCVEAIDVDDLVGVGLAAPSGSIHATYLSCSGCPELRGDLHLGDAFLIAERPADSGSNPQRATDGVGVFLDLEISAEVTSILATRLRSSVGKVPYTPDAVRVLNPVRQLMRDQTLMNIVLHRLDEIGPEKLVSVAEVIRDASRTTVLKCVYGTLHVRAEDDPVRSQCFQ